MCRTCLVRIRSPPWKTDAVAIGVYKSSGYRLSQKGSDEKRKRRNDGTLHFPYRVPPISRTSEQDPETSQRSQPCDILRQLRLMAGEELVG
jgi:hypothetical protein